MYGLMEPLGHTVRSTKMQTDTAINSGIGSPAGSATGAPDRSCPCRRCYQN